MHAKKTTQTTTIIKPREAPRVHQDVGVNCKGDANPAHLPRLRSLFCTWICAGNLGSRAGLTGPGARLSQWGEQVGR
jgi:hypothetical protein